ncbi:hypothetical protein EQZ23_05400 [Sphingomonas sp. UV9]|uniref:M12 family metallo-peptidase n=1 Tax=Sphingomonas sp. UV9 TaxID=1851410 RepID=UPI000FFBF4E5|nr:M12 family metallo-peptidase [Sphingomonas sp. UV9]RXD07465.1 hypothetical protein EQZ23_05400 [Sphingomonas sp. UV9]
MRSIVALAFALTNSMPCFAQEVHLAAPAGQSLFVTLDGKHSRESWDRLKADLQVSQSDPVPNLDAEVWHVPTDKVASAFRAVRRRDIAAIDYVGEDYRTLFLPVSGADLGPTQSRAFQQISADQALKDIHLVRLRTGDTTSRLLDKTKGTAEGAGSEAPVVFNVRPGLDVLANRRLASRTADNSLEWSGSGTSLADSATNVPGSTAAADPAATSAPAGLPDGTVNLIVTGDRITGSVEVGTETFSIIPLSGGLHAIAKVDQTTFPAEHPSVRQTSETNDAMPLENVARDLSSSATADASASGPLTIGVAYTRQALDSLRAARPGTTIEALAALAIAHTNSGFANSDIRGSVALAGTTELSGTEIADFDTMTDAVVAQGDNRFDDVHAWRRRVRADAVIVFVAMDAYCGNAAGIHVNAAHSFALVNWRCAWENSSFPHELGHLLGARHDPDTDPEDKPFAYAHGFRNGNYWRTIMAYAGGECTTCPRINRWANPNQTLDGMPLGTSARNYDAKLISEMLPVYARNLP